MRIASINIGTAETVAYGNKSFETGICKRPVDGPVRIGALGVDGDTIVSTRHHGGPDQAIYAYSTDDYDWWEREVGINSYPGLFGENLTISDLPTNLFIGDRLLIGEVVLEVTAPRIPCETFAARMQDTGFGIAFRQAERPGAYLRVLNEGSVRNGDVVTLVEAVDCNVSILDLFRQKYSLRHEAEELRRLLDAPLAARFRAQIESRLASLV